MSATERFDRDFADLLAELAEPRFPDYFDTVLARATSAKQRPAWTFPERWFPMGVLARSAALRPALPARMLGLLILLLLALVASIAIGVGALLLQQARPAPPFGLAANGDLAYSISGDIYARDPTTGEARLLVGGPTEDIGPWYTPDGTKLLFIRIVDPELEVVELMIANADGSNVRTLVEAERSGGWHWWYPAPDGDLVVINNSDRSAPQLSVVDVATGARTPIEVPVRVEGFEWLPDGSEIIFRGADGGQVTFYAIRPDGSGLRQLNEPRSNFNYDARFQVSHDGRMAGYNGRAGSIHVWYLLDLETLEERVRVPPIGQHEGHPTFSPDNERVAFIRYDDGNASTIRAQAMVGTIAGDGSEATPIGPGIRIRQNTKGLSIQFSPDGESLLITSDEGQIWLANVATGEYEGLVFDKDELDIAWQRRAP